MKQENGTILAIKAILKKQIKDYKEREKKDV